MKPRVYLHADDGVWLQQGETNAIRKAAKRVQAATRDVRPMHILVVESFAGDPDVIGRGMQGEPGLYLTTALVREASTWEGLFRQGTWIPDDFMPVWQSVTPLEYTVAHEWGHTWDQRFGEDVLWREPDFPVRFMPEMVPYGFTEGEAYAEAFAEWFLTEGQTSNGAAKWYARKHGW